MDPITTTNRTVPTKQCADEIYRDNQGPFSGFTTENLPVFLQNNELIDELRHNKDGFGWKTDSSDDEEHENSRPPKSTALSNGYSHNLPELTQSTHTGLSLFDKVRNSVTGYKLPQLSKLFSTRRYSGFQPVLTRGSPPEREEPEVYQEDCSDDEYTRKNTINHAVETQNQQQRLNAIFPSRNTL
ncbi:uncharacterized protein LOC143244201 [Tachypleus tridentatus]|uniref:uncharacterized protein LOC143244201 n=1 Tax=Tachypleus tridentatus TaxID=6853 RepID=UPI003FCF5875